MLDSAHTRPTGAPIGTRLSLGILGGLSLTVAGMPLGLNHKRKRLILAYLALSEGRPVARERLAGLLWDAGERQARSSLRTELSELGRALAQLGCMALERSGNDLRLAPGSFTLDLNEILAAIAIGQVPALLAAQPQACRQILAGLEDVSEGTRAWIDEVRAAAEFAVRTAIETAMSSPKISRRARRAMAELAMRIDPLDEAACRTAMRLAAEDGEIGAALKAYEALYESLGADLDMEPGAETLALVAAIKMGAVNAPPVVVQGTGNGPARVAVLPFATPDATLQAFAEGVVEGTIHVLSGIGDLFVINRGSIMTYAHQTPDPRAVGRELGVGYVLGGRISRIGNSLRVATELVETAGGVILRADRHDVGEAGLFDIQDRIAEQLVATLAPAVKSQELARARRKPPSEQSAYDLMLQGVDLQYELSEATYERAGLLLYEAIRIDPGFAPSYAHAATWHNFRIGQGWSPDRAADAAAAARHAARALDLDRDNAVALAIQGQVHSFHNRNYRLARRYLDRALEAGPSCVMAWTLSSATHGWTGAGAEAVAHARRALELSPRDPFAFFAEHMLSQGHYMAGEHESAIAIAERVEERSPHLTSNHRTLAAALGSRLNQVHPMSMAAMATAEAKLLASLSYRVWTRRQSFIRPMVRSMMLRAL